jgi:hypothetical protein
MKRTSVLFILFFLCFLVAHGQEDKTVSESHSGIKQDDPSQFITRAEVFNELMKLQSGEFLNFTTFRSVIALGKKFSTRFEIPYMYNSSSVTGYDNSGIGDISVRLLGYKIIQSPNVALAASIEFSFNTAQSPALGTGKNLIIPLISYSRLFTQKKTIVGFVFEQFYSLRGDESRQDIQWTKLQALYLKGWSKKVWTLVAPEFYYDHNDVGASMNLEASVYYKLSGRMTVWGKGGVGLFGDHTARYNYTTEVGLRYLMIRKPTK